MSKKARWRITLLEHYVVKAMVWEKKEFTLIFRINCIVYTYTFAFIFKLAGVSFSYN